MDKTTKCPCCKGVGYFCGVCRKRADECDCEGKDKEIEPCKECAGTGRVGTGIDHPIRPIKKEPGEIDWETWDEDDPMYFDEDDYLPLMDDFDIH